MRFYTPAVVTISTLNAAGWDANLVVPAARKITVDHIAETTGAHGIVTDQALKPAAGVTGNLTQNADLVIPAAYKVTVDHIAETSVGHGIVHDKIIDAGTHAIINVVNPTNLQDADTSAARGAAIAALPQIRSLASASDTVKKRDLTPVGITGSSYTIKKTLTTPSHHLANGVYRIKFDLYAYDGSAWGSGYDVCYGRIYIDGVVKGTERNLTGTGSTEPSASYSEDITITSTAPFAIQVYCKTNSARSGIVIKDFQVCFSENISTVW